MAQKTYHWLLQAARIDPYTHKVVYKELRPDGSPRTITAQKATAMQWIRKSQADGPQGDGCIHTWLVLSKTHEVDQDYRGPMRQQFKPVVRPREPEIYEDTETVESLQTATAPNAMIGAEQPIRRGPGRPRKEG